ncbi:MAG: hypothetical protein AB7N76_06235 [Planctomycetota bacterium]
MTDEQLRALERQWLKSRSVEDEALFLAERLRQGELPPERLQLAACCGHRAAALACHAPPAGHLLPQVAKSSWWTRRLKTGDFAQGMSFEPSGAVLGRLLLALALYLQPRFEHSHQGDLRPRRAIGLACAYFEAAPVDAEALKTSAQECRRAASWEFARGDELARAIHHTAGEACQSVRFVLGQSELPVDIVTLRHGLLYVANCVGLGAIEAALSADFLSWLLAPASEDHWGSGGTEATMPGGAT